jgi:hypothetical protein
MIGNPRARCARRAYRGLSRRGPTQRGNDGCCTSISVGGGNRCARDLPGLTTRAGRRRVRAPSAGGDNPLQAARGTLAVVPGRDRGGGRQRARPSALRRRRGRVVPQVRDSGSRVHPGRLRRLPGEPSRGVFLQAPRLLPVLPRPPNGRLRRAPPRSRDAPRARAAVGADRSVRPPVRRCSTRCRRRSTRKWQR